MTIFNWVQKKLHQNVIEDGVAKNERKKKSEGKSEIEKNTKAIMDEVGAFDNWFDGVLTIGTFGFDTLKFQDHNDHDHEYLRDYDECDESADLEFVVIDGSFDHELAPLIPNDNKLYDDFGILENDHIDSIKAAEMAAEPKKRTTLAELFMEDQDNNHQWLGKNPNLDDDQEVTNCKHNGSKLSGKFSFAKKKMIKPKSKDETEHLRPIKKLHQMMKRMLKKKIHPDIDSAKAFKNDGQYKPTNKREALETIYLLNIQGHVA